MQTICALLVFQTLELKVNPATISPRTVNTSASIATHAMARVAAHRDIEIDSEFLLRLAETSSFGNMKGRASAYPGGRVM